MRGEITNDDVARLMLSATERLTQNDYDAAIVHLKSAVGVLGLLKKRARIGEKLPGLAGDVVGALEGLGVDSALSRKVVKEILASGMGGFDNVFRAAMLAVRQSGSRAA